MNNYPTIQRQASPGRPGAAACALRSAVAAMVLVTSNPLLAQGLPEEKGKEQFVEIGGDGSPGKVNIAKGQFLTAKTEADIVKVIVGNPEVATTVPLSAKTFYILAKGNGRTNAAVLGADDKLIGTLTIEVGADVADIVSTLQQGVPQSNTKVDTVNGRLRVDGTVQDAMSLRKAIEVVGAHSDGGPPPINNLKVTGSQQVMLEVRLIEASRNAGRELGISMNGSGDGFSFGQALTPLSQPFGAALANVLKGGVNVDVVVQALEQKGLARRLAEPNLIALSGEKASFLAGGEIPIPIADNDGKVTVQFKEYGVRLNFTPVVLDGGLINLKLEPEVSQVDESVKVTTGAISIPSFITRRASTTIEVRDGQSFAMAGLLQSTHTKVQDQIPILGELPIIGALARSSNFQKKETDLVIIVTPHLVRPAPPGQHLRTPFDLRNPSNDKDFFLNGKLEVAPRAERPQPAPVVGASVDPQQRVAPQAAPQIEGPYGHIVEMPRRKRNVAPKEARK